MKLMYVSYMPYTYDLEKLYVIHLTILLQSLKHCSLEKFQLWHLSGFENFGVGGSLDRRYSNQEVTAYTWPRTNIRRIWTQVHELQGMVMSFSWMKCRLDYNRSIGVVLQTGCCFPNKAHFCPTLAQAWQLPRHLFSSRPYHPFLAPGL